MSTKNFEQKIIGSALWAAAGDALGWITEMARGVAGVERRTGSPLVKETVPWVRMIAGKTGPRVSLPAGTYSDDTQLRLAVSRSIRGNGFFDAETFAKVELTVWPSYALGGGLGTKAAALNLSKRGVNWFSNFFERGDQHYINGGGNGAAMRIQPHVWSAGKKSDEMILNVMRDSIITHGHPHGFCGAVFHALCLADTLETNNPPSPDSWLVNLEKLYDLPEIINRDPQLADFWYPMWEGKVDSSLPAAIWDVVEEARSDINKIKNLVFEKSTEKYHLILGMLGCLEPKYRGSGLKTAIAASALAYIYSDLSIEDALCHAANELESDTDTIGTMVGAILGVTSAENPKWTLQDRNYIEYEARRLSKIAMGIVQESFSYPDLGWWNPPTNQLSAVGLGERGFALTGLGLLVEIGEKYHIGDSTWQWFELPFGQTIIVKRRSLLKDYIPKEQLPFSVANNQREPVEKKIEIKNTTSSQSGFSFDYENKRKGKLENKENLEVNFLEGHKNYYKSLEFLTNEVIKSNFDDVILGKLFNKCLDDSIEVAIAFAAIVSKAKLARNRK